MKKKVWFVASNPFNPDPRAEKQMLTLSNNGYEVSGIGWDRNKNTNYIYKFNDEIKIYEIGVKSSFGSGIKNLIPLLKYNLKLFYYLLKNNKKIDIIQSVNLDTGIVCHLFSKFLKKRMVYDIYDYYADAFPVPSKLKKIVKMIENHIINSSDFIILPIDSRRKQIIQSNPKKIIVIYNTPDYAMKYIPNMSSMYKQNKINISFVGALVSDRFLNELIELSNERSDIFIHIAGFGNDELIRRIKNHNNNIKFYGKVSYKEGLAISNMSDLMLAVYNPKVPNHKYSAPNKFYESLFLGKPIIVANDTGIDNLVRKYHVGYTVDYDKTKFENLLNNLNLSVLGSFKENNQKVYNDHFSWTEMRKKLLNQYESLH